jgi:DNA-binding NarL/FixJ family response regulator
MGLSRIKSRTAPSKVLLVDDHVVFRQGLRRLLAKESAFLVCGEADGSEELVNIIAAKQPDLVLLDLALAGMSGIELTRTLKARFPTLKILIVSMHDETMYAARALKAGAMGYVMKREPPQRLIAAMRLVLQGHVHINPLLVPDLLRNIPEHDGSASSEGARPAQMDRLSRREMEVFRLIGQGRGTRQIAEMLQISVKTVESYRAHIKEKLQLVNSFEMVRAAIQWIQRETLG